MLTGNGDWCYNLSRSSISGVSRVHYKLNLLDLPRRRGKKSILAIGIFFFFYETVLSV